MRTPRLQVADSPCPRTAAWDIRRLAESSTLPPEFTDRARTLNDQERRNLTREAKKLTAEIENAKHEFVSTLEGSTHDHHFAASRDKFRDKRSEILAKSADVNDRLARNEKQAQQLVSASDILRDLPELWDKMSWTKKQELASCLIEEMTLTPEKTCVLLRLKLIFSEAESYRLYCSSNHYSATGLDALSPSNLAVAHYLLQGRDKYEIAKIQQVSLQDVVRHIARLRKCTGASDVAEMLRTLAPIVDERFIELKLGVALKRQKPKPLTEQERVIIALITQGDNDGAISNASQAQAHSAKVGETTKTHKKGRDQEIVARYLR